MMAYWLKNIAILNVKSVDIRGVVWNMPRNNAVNMLGDSKLDDKDALWIWTLVQIKPPVEVFNYWRRIWRNLF